MDRGVFKELVCCANHIIGLALFFAWFYITFFSCNLAQQGTLLRGSELSWMSFGLGELLVGILCLSIKKMKISLKDLPGFVLAGGISGVGTVLVWAAFASSPTSPFLLVLGGLIAGVGGGILLLYWGKVFASLDERQTESVIPSAFILSILLYFILLFFRNSITIIANIVLPILSAWFLFFDLTRSRSLPCVKAGIQDSGGNLEQKRDKEKELSQDQQGIVKPPKYLVKSFFLIGLLWWQFAYFRLISTPNEITGRFLHYLFPFLSAFIIAIVGFLLLLRYGRYVNFTLSFRWALPLIAVSYSIYALNSGTSVQRITAYTLNFAAMFGMQMSVWVALAKILHRTGLASYRVVGGSILAEGLGIALGCAAGFYALDALPAELVIGRSLFGLAILIAAVMFIGFDPHWFSFGAANREEHRGYEAGRGVYTESFSVDSIGRSSYQDRYAPFPRANIHDSGSSDKDAEAEDFLYEGSLDELFYEKACMLGDEFGLTTREIEIASMLLAGRNRPFIRDELTIALNTVHAHVRNIYAKCNVHSQQELLDLMRDR